MKFVYIETTDRDVIDTTKNKKIEVTTHTRQHVVIIYDELATMEIYNAAADIYDAIMLQPQSDISRIGLQYFRSRATLFQQISNKLSHNYVDDINQYIDMICNDVSLRTQFIKISRLRPPMRCSIGGMSDISVIKEHIHTLYANLVQPMSYIFTDIPEYMPNMFVQRPLENMDYCKYSKAYMLHDKNEHETVYKLIRSQKYHLYTLSANKYGLVNGMLELCKLVVNVNFLDAAPYGVVTMGATTMLTTGALCNTENMYPTYMAYSMPDAYVTVDNAPHNHQAYVSVAMMSHLPEKSRVFYDYAIYRQDDIYSAIFTRFGDQAKIAELHLLRLKKMRNMVIENHSKTKIVHFCDTEIQFFYFRGIFNARFIDTKLAESDVLNSTLLELIDIYRDVQLMGIRMYNNKASLTFPRIMVRFSNPAEHNAKIMGMHKKAISYIIDELLHIINGVQAYICSVQVNNPLLAKMYNDAMKNALSSPLSVARENVRLAFSMTHDGLHRYAQHVAISCGEDDIVLSQYVRAAILQCGYTDCDECRQIYASFSDKNRLKQNRSPQALSNKTHIIDDDVSMFCKRLASMKTKLYTVSCRTLKTYEQHEYVTNEECIMAELRGTYIAKRHRSTDLTQQAQPFDKRNDSEMFAVPYGYTTDNTNTHDFILQQKQQPIHSALSVYTVDTHAFHHKHTM